MKDGDLMDSHVIWMGKVPKNGTSTYRIVARKLFGAGSFAKDHFVEVVAEVASTDATGSKIWQSTGPIGNYAAECALAMMAKVPESKSWLRDWFSSGN